MDEMNPANQSMFANNPNLGSIQNLNMTGGGLMQQRPRTSNNWTGAHQNSVDAMNGLQKVQINNLMDH